MPLRDDALPTLTAVLDTLIPPSEDGRLPGAGELGLKDRVLEVLAESPELEPFLADGLAAADAAAGKHGAADFGALAAEARQAVLEEVAAAHPALIPALTFHVFVAYYQHERVMRAIGLEARPPHPLGYAVAESDLSLLDPVRARPPLYRD